MSKKDNFALALRSPVGLERAGTGAKRILVVMVAEMLAVVRESADPLPVRVEKANALEWHLKEAENASTESLLWLGMNFLSGDKAPQDYVEAYKWLWLAAEQGSSEAYEYFWITVERVGGESYAEESDYFHELLSDEQIQEAGRRATEFQEKHWYFGGIFDADGCVMFFTGTGRVYPRRADEIIELSRTNIGDFLNLKTRDMGIVAAIRVPLETKPTLFFCTQRGTVKKTDLEDFAGAWKWGRIAIGIEPDDALVDVKLTRGSVVENNEVKDPGDDILIITRNGLSIRFHESDVRVMGRAAGGVRGIALRHGDAVLGFFVVSNAMLLIADENGAVRLLNFEKFQPQPRGREGVIIDNTIARLVGALTVENSDEVMFVTKSGLKIRKCVNDLLGGGPIRLMHGDKLVSVESATDTSQLNRFRTR